MNYSDIEIVFQEVPGEISICFTITGCKFQCKGCHSPHLWKEENGKELTLNKYLEILDKYNGFASCVLFMGGEWFLRELIKYLKIAKKKGFKTCLYTGEAKVDQKLLSELTWLKTEPWIQNLGGLESEFTNQKFIEIKTNKILNHLFLNN
jgi:anaerobic ribonucleoside-triphosphate reductase activating protein